MNVNPFFRVAIIIRMLYEICENVLHREIIVRQIAQDSRLRVSYNESCGLTANTSNFKTVSPPDLRRPKE